MPWWRRGERSVPRAIGDTRVVEAIRRGVVAARSCVGNQTRELHARSEAGSHVRVGCVRSRGALCVFDCRCECVFHAEACGALRACALRRSAFEKLVASALATAVRASLATCTVAPRAGTRLNSATGRVGDRTTAAGVDTRHPVTLVRVNLGSCRRLVRWRSRREVPPHPAQRPARRVTPARLPPAMRMTPPRARTAGAPRPWTRTGTRARTRRTRRGLRMETTRARTGSANATSLFLLRRRLRRASTTTTTSRCCTKNSWSSAPRTTRWARPPPL